MTQFEFFMAFYGLLLGLGVAELLGAFANLLREKSPPRVGLLTPLLGVIVLTEMLANFIDAWVKFQDIAITLPTLILPTLIGVIYYVIAVIVVPRDLSEWSDLDDYMALRRRWIVGLLILANCMIAVLEVTRIDRTFTGGPIGLTWRWVISNLWLIGSYALIFFGRPRWLVVVAAGSVFAFYTLFYGIIPVISA